MVADNTCSVETHTDQSPHFGGCGRSCSRHKGTYASRDDQFDGEAKRTANCYASKEDRRWSSES